MSTRSYKVTAQHRTNSLHERGGGTTITVHYKQAPSKVYENIQYPEGYIRRIKEGEDWISGNIVDIVVGDATSEHPTDSQDLPF
jgi:hypothetical protein